jgi:outer membrane protein OmpA-like peptidoglycan-associated protein
MALVQKKQSEAESSWISFSDIMTGLMVIFLFIAISFMLQVQKEKQAQDDIIEEYKETQVALYLDLKQEFENDFSNWDAELGEDLTIKFTNPEVLFATGSSRLTPKFKSILSDFLPRYTSVLLQSRYKDKIEEIRIEGHADDQRRLGSYSNSYMGNLELSNDRSESVMDYFITSNFYDQYSASDKSWLRFHLTANGLSFGRALDSQKQFTFDSGASIDGQLSRRVEFKIVTNSEALVRQIYELMNK